MSFLRKSVSKRLSPNTQLHVSLDGVYLFDPIFLAPKRKKTIGEALDNITAALENEADINSLRNSNSCALTILQHTVLCTHNIGKLAAHIGTYTAYSGHEGQKVVKARTRDLLHIIQFLIEKKAEVTKQPLLDLLLPEINSAETSPTQDVSPYIEIMKFLFTAGAYQINKAKAIAVSNYFASLELKELIYHSLLKMRYFEKYF